MFIPWIPIIIVAAVAIGIYGFLLERKEARQDRAELRNIVEVNLSILKKDLASLNEIAQGTPPTTGEVPTAAERQQANALLIDAADSVKTVEEKDLASASKDQLCGLLTTVFAGMEQARRSRHLLKACRPLSEFGEVSE